MGNLAEDLYQRIKWSRSNPSAYRGGMSPFAQREFDKLFPEPHTSEIWYSGALANAARHIANEEGACGTYGDANGNSVEEVLNKYYAHKVGDIEVLKVTGP